jgi:hypothetical protein
LRVLKRNAEELPAKLKLESARRRAQPRLEVLAHFLNAAEAEADSLPY